MSSSWSWSRWHWWQRWTVWRHDLLGDADGYGNHLFEAVPVARFWRKWRAVADCYLRVLDSTFIVDRQRSEPGCSTDPGPIALEPETRMPPPLPSASEGGQRSEPVQGPWVLRHPWWWWTLRCWLARRLRRESWHSDRALGMCNWCGYLLVTVDDARDYLEAMRSEATS